MIAAGRFDDDESRWQAVVQRDAEADGRFVYSVRTTGVYCRPVCAARLPKRENVRFHCSTEQAEQAGFRPCKRCRPTGASMAQRHREAIASACRLIENAEEAPALAALADSVGLCPSHFHRLFTRLMGLTPKAYVDARRSMRVRDQLERGATVTQAIHAAGFQSSGRFYETSTARLGMRPKSYRSGGEGTTIRFALGECSLGIVLVAATEKGVCAILLGDDPDSLEHDLRERFSRANIVRGDDALNRSVAAVIGLVERPPLGLDLPLDIRGTSFQLRVWEALRRIPPGSTASYQEIAQQIGQPTAARAVALACAANPIAIAIPCHRVVRTDKSISGYRWGVERKAELLKRERLST